MLGSRLSNFIVGTMNVSTPVLGLYSLCATYPSPVQNSAILTVACFSTTAPGSHVFVQLLTQNYLHMCEVEVYESGVCTTEIKRTVFIEFQRRKLIAIFIY